MTSIKSILEDKGKSLNFNRVFPSFYFVFLLKRNKQEISKTRHEKDQKQSPQPATLLTKRLCHRCFPVNFAKFLRAPFLIEHLQWLLLKDQCHEKYCIKTATSKTWTRTLKNQDPEKPGPSKTWETAGCRKMIRRPHHLLTLKIC